MKNRGVSSAGFLPWISLEYPDWEMVDLEGKKTHAVTGP